MTKLIKVSPEKDEKGVFVSLTCAYPIDGQPLNFYRSSESTLEVRLLANELNKQVSAMFERVRQRAYEQGWKDKASRKVKKQDWFSSHAGLKRDEE